LLALAGVTALALLLTLPLAWKEQAVLGAVLILFAMLLSAASHSIAVTMMLMTISVFSTLRYGYWRVVQTWEGITSAGHMHRWDTVFVLLLLGAEFYAFSTLILGYFQTLKPLRRPLLPLGRNRAMWPTVDVLVPTFNDYPVTLGVSARYVLVCRGGSGLFRDDVAVDSIRSGRGC